jgi:hypothetical protein
MNKQKSYLTYIWIRSLEKKFYVLEEEKTIPEIEKNQSRNEQAKSYLT